MPGTGMVATTVRGVPDSTRMPSRSSSSDTGTSTAAGSGPGSGPDRPVVRAAPRSAIGPAPLV
ncbi:hypothetical protein GCM10009759_61740 [Kitasatospora saccharophila]|uniref:Uncharacterized protein n=1 Tax=Kitasatospora saccharophila TaxID=407973 RepID=A0ABP5JJB2_9ACTN